MAVVSVPIHVNGALRPSRLIKSIPSYVWRSIVTIVRISILYHPFRFFGVLGAVLFGLGVLLGLRFLWLFTIGEGQGHTQSLILAAVLSVIGFQTLLVAILADLLAANRKLLEDIRYRLRKLSEDRENSGSERRDNE